MHSQQRKGRKEVSPLGGVGALLLYSAVAGLAVGWVMGKAWIKTMPAVIFGVVSVGGIAFGVYLFLTSYERQSSVRWCLSFVVVLSGLCALLGRLVVK